MKLIKVSARNLKGLTFSLDLRAINFLVGTNFAGKTARADAIRLVLVGHLPELGKLARATFGICSGRELSVVGEFDDGSRIARRWYLKGDAVKTEEQLPAWMEGNAAQLATVMLNAETYFALSERDRVAYVFENIPGVGADSGPTNLLVGVQGVLLARDWEGLKPEAVADAVRKIIGRLHAQIDLGDQARCLPWTPQTFIEYALAAATEHARQGKEFAVRMERTAQGLASLRAGDAATVDFAAVEAKIAALKLDIEAAQGAKARHAAALDAIRANRRRRAELLQAIAGRPGIEAQLKGALARRDEIAAARDLIPEATAAEVEALRVEEKEAALGYQRATDEIRLNDGGARNLEAERADIASRTTCPYCGAAGEGWRAIKEAEIDSALAGLRVKREQLGEHAARIAEHFRNLTARYASARANEGLRAGKAADLRTAGEGIAALERRIEAFAGAEAELGRIPAEDPAVQAAVETAQTTLNVKNDELRRLEEQRTAGIGRQHDLQRLAQAEGERDAARVDEAVGKAAADALRAAQAAMVASAFEPLLAEANAIFGGILRTPLAYHEGEIGTWREGTWVGHRTFSGSEQALAYAAIQSALAARAPVRIMVLDELGVLDDVNLALIFAGVASAIKRGVVDQFLGIDVGRQGFYEALGDAGGSHGVIGDIPAQVVRIEEAAP